MQRVEYPADAARVLEILTQKQRSAEDRGGEYHRHHATCVYAKRHVGALSAHHFAADNSLGVLHWNPALASFYENDERDNRDHSHNQQRHRWDCEPAPSLGFHFLVQVSDATGQSNNNAGKDQE